MTNILENSADDPRANRCGHNFQPSACPYRYCAVRDSLAAMEQIAKSTSQPSAPKDPYDLESVAADFVRWWRKAAPPLAIAWFQKFVAENPLPPAPAPEETPVYCQSCRAAVVVAYVCNWPMDYQGLRVLVDFRLCQECYEKAQQGGTHAR